MTEVVRYRSELSLRNRLGRGCWALAWGLFCRFSPRPLHGWRRLWLILFGARIHRTAAVYPSARVWAPWNLKMGARSALGDDVECYNVDQITLAEDAVASQQAFLCTASHDITDPGKRLITAPIHLRRMSWVCAGAFIHPGVTLGEGAVAGARSVVTRDVAPWTVVAGNPAIFRKERSLSAPAADGSGET